jgi:hypothetical protein
MFIFFVVCLFPSAILAVVLKAATSKFITRLLNKIFPMFVTEILGAIGGIGTWFYNISSA